MGIRQLFTYCISDLFLVICLGIFMKRRCRWKMAAGVLTAVYLMTVSLEYLRFWLYSQGISGRYTILIALLVGSMLPFTIAEYRDSRTLFAILMAASYSMCGSMAAKILNAMEVSLGWVIVAEILVHLGILFLLIQFFLPSFRKLQQVYREEWRLFSMVLGMLVCCMYLLYACLKHSDVTVFHNIVPLFYLLCVYVMLTLALRLLVRINEDEIEASQQKILDASMEVLKREVAQVRQTERKIAAYNHDSRHFTRMLAGMMAEGNYEGVRAALCQQPDLSDILSTKRYCGNLPFNSVLSCYASVAKENQIAIEIRADAPEHTGGRDWEQAVIFENLLEQAVVMGRGGKTPEERKIEVRLRQEGDGMLFEIRNTYVGTIPLDKATRLPVFVHQERHGFGMKSIRLYVERLSGTLDCWTDGAWYCVRMRMPSAASGFHGPQGCPVEESGGRGGEGTDKLDTTPE